MTNLIGLFGTAFDLLLVVLGFGLIIFFHELGHFLAAKWARIRVLAFAIGFGPAICSFRKGMGLRMGSTEPEYQRLLDTQAAGAMASGGARPNISPTEYRLNWLPLGGYVKMLGQEDLNPGAVSDSPDSYQSVPPWKRMVVISAGVVMNMIVAAMLFIAVFMVGLETEPARIGGVVPGSAAAQATPVNGAAEPGLRTGDEVLLIDGERPKSFNDLVLAAAMADPNTPLRIEVARPGADRPLVFDLTPTQSSETKLMEIGIEPARSPVLYEAATDEDAAFFRQRMKEIGLDGVEPGMRLVQAGNDTEILDAHELAEAVERSGGEPVRVVFTDGERRVEGVLEPSAELEADLVKRGEVYAAHEHLLGLTPVMRVVEVAERGREQGLRDGDIFVRLGALEYPSITAGIPEIRRHRGGPIPIVVRRTDEQGRATEVELDVTVGSDGSIGFIAGDTADDSALLALPPRELKPADGRAEAYTPAAASIIERPGERIVSVDGTPVGSFRELRAALRRATEAALHDGEATAAVPLTIELPLPVQPDGRAPTRTVEWTLARADIERLHALGWRSPLGPWVFKPEQTLLKAENPLAAVRMGVEETHRVMMTTYLTFLRLFQGTVQVEHLKGPVGIAELGTRIASRGYIWLLFFLALISVNLAVINFLPMPIVDGGQFLMLVAEQIRGKPVPIAVQNAATFVGLILIGAMFLMVTFNDIVNLFGG